ncbi:MAG: hypothetical protein QOI54_2859 [Actinomycetota bacterium]|jgi:DivIVA domain-containing protein|nr:hypothetical protein [Actinomycetota bacterium]
MFPRASRLRRGYHCRQVERFLADVELSYTGAHPPVTATDVRRAGFELVHHGYDPGAVDSRLDELEERLLALRSASGGGRRGRDDPSSDLLFLREELVSPYMRRFARAGALRRGYDMDDVDDFIDQVADTLAGGDAQLTVDDVRRVTFRPRRGGYDELAVDETLDRVVEALLMLRRPDPAGARTQEVSSPDSLAPHLPRGEDAVHG